MPLLEPEDRLLLTALQEGLAATEEPYAELAARVGTTEEDVLERIRRLKSQGIIRRIGVAFNSRDLGFVSTLCALPVPDSRVGEVAAVVNSYPGVSHNYLREHDDETQEHSGAQEYNMWFTLTAPSEQELIRTLQEISAKTGITKMLNLPGIQIFKVDVKFDLSEV